MLMAECGTRVAGYPPMDTSPQFEHDRIYWSEDPNQVNEPHRHGELNTTFPVSTDVNGLRAPLHDQQKPAGTFRVMTLGCSTTFGWGVADAESYPARLEHYLRDRGHKNVEVINGGQPGYTTFQGLWLWEKTLKDYAPDLVVVGYIVQDARQVAYSDISQALMQNEASFLKENFLYRSQFYRALMFTLGRVRTQSKEQKRDSYRVPPEDYLNHLRRFQSKIADLGGTPLYFGFPLERVGYTELHRDILRIEAEQQGIAHFDPSAEIEDLTRSQELYFPKDRGHANARGCDTIARLMADYLEAQELIP
jgi:lysophospholipase L1-like esterase